MDLLQTAELKNHLGSVPLEEECNWHRTAFKKLPRSQPADRIKCENHKEKPCRFARKSRRLALLCNCARESTKISPPNFFQCSSTRLKKLLRTSVTIQIGGVAADFAQLHVHTHACACTNTSADNDHNSQCQCEFCHASVHSACSPTL